MTTFVQIRFIFHVADLVMVVWAVPLLSTCVCSLMPPLPLRAAFAYSTISFFILYILSFGIDDKLSNGSQVDVDLSAHKGSF